MRIIAGIAQPEVIAKILTHLGLWPDISHGPPESAVAEPPCDPDICAGARPGSTEGVFPPPGSRRPPPWPIGSRPLIPVARFRLTFALAARHPPALCPLPAAQSWIRRGQSGVARRGESKFLPAQQISICLLT